MIHSIIPNPLSVQSTDQTFLLPPLAKIIIDPGSPEITWIGKYLSTLLSRSTGYPLPVVHSMDTRGNILLTTHGADPSLGEEGYELSVEPDAIKLTASYPTGLFWGVQTLRQMLPASIETQTVQPGPWTVPTGKIADTPRFEYRGMMLDVSRHFFGVADIKRLVDLLALYKVNRLHLHLSDDQGWRIQIDSWPKLTEIGGNTVGEGGKPGFYTKADYQEIVAYAQERFIMVVPEIDTPGHTNAALSSYPELNADGMAPAPYTGFKVGFSSLAVRKEITYQFLDDVVRELAEITPGPYLHIGGDEAASTTDEDYLYFMGRIQAIVRKHGKQMVAWEEAGTTPLDPSSVVQLWRMSVVEKAVAQGVKLIVSPANRTYLDMKYTPDTVLGLDWAALIEVKDSYDWEPLDVASGAPEASKDEYINEYILGVEAPLWAETLLTMKDIEYLAFPRLLSIAEIGWSQKERRSWSDFRQRLGEQGLRLSALDVNYYHSPQVEWK